MDYNFRDIEKKWQSRWIEEGVYKVPNESQKPKYYVLDMFPYPSGAGLHVGHPLGYIASDIVARYKRLKGFNVLHPMGYDAFGLPAEQYAIEHGVHPAASTAKNIATFRSQLDKIGFCFDWSREVNTSNPKYYKWTQWIFLQLFKSWYNRKTNKTEHIDTLIKIFEEEGNINHPVPEAKFEIRNENFEVLNGKFSAEQWKLFDEKTKQDVLMEYRVAYCGYGEVNWCEALGTVLANDEVVNGVSERGGYPVVKKKLRQWYLRITEYADRLLEGLQKVDFSDAMKEMQTNWIGKSSGAEIEFCLIPNPSPSRMEKGAVSSAEEKEDGNGTGSLVEEPYPKYGVKNNVQYENAKTNRKNSTEAEAELWKVLRNNQTGYKFRRQHPIESFITDFVCLQKGLIVEIDGGYHTTQEQQEYDANRTKILEQKGFKILRFTNEEILQNVFAVKDKIKTELESLSDSKIVSDTPPLSSSTGDEIEDIAESQSNDDTAPLYSKAGNEIGDIVESQLNDDTAPLSSKAGEGLGVRAYTTRPDTIFGVDFMVIAPEHELVEQITTADQKQAVEEYIAYVKSRSERERMAEKKISGVFTGGYAINPFNEREIPIWISEYVLAGYGTGAIMAVPSGDERDFKFAKHFGIPITNILGDAYNGEEANPTKDAVLSNSGFLDGLVMRNAIDVVIGKLEEMGIGKRKINYKMRDAAFSRQRYWGEPFPIKWINGVAYPLDESELPLELPHVESYKPGPEGEGPLANIPEWTAQHLETNTMPGYAGSSWYFLRYMDPHNDNEFCDKQWSNYWSQVDLYVGGTEHAVGHLLYSRMWTKCMFDLGLINFDEPYKKLLNQGMIQGSSRFVYRKTYGVNDKNLHPVFVSFNKRHEKDTENFISEDLKDHGFNVENYNFNNKVMVEESVNAADRTEAYIITPIHVDVNIVDGVELDIEAFRKSKAEYADAEFILEDEKYICGVEVEKMSKSKVNTVNPDHIVERYGADTFRMYEMFLGPVEMSKPWDTKGIEGVHRFLKKLWRLFFDEQKGKLVKEEKATPAELKILHRTIKKIEEDTERFSFNTAVSAFMVCVNELTDLKCHKKEVLEQLLILLVPYAPHVSEELWHHLGHETTILNAAFPKFDPQYLVETTKEYPVSINGKLRTTINLALDASQEQVQEIVLANPIIQKWMEGKPLKKLIFVKGKMVNVVV